MKTRNLLALTLFSTSIAMGAIPQAKMTIKAIDAETTHPMSNAVVRTRFLIKEHWNKANEYKEQKQQANEKGTCVLESKDMSFGYGGRVMSEGYYASNFKVPYTGKNKLLNRWEPWNPMIKVAMRPEKNSVPKVQHWVQREDIPVWDEAVGFDLEKGDWIAPFGKGSVSDFLLKAVPVTEPKEGVRYSLTFPNPLDGIQEYVPPKDLQSSFIFPYLAPTNGYASSFSRYRLLKYPMLPDYPANNLKEDKDINYIFRTRTEVDEDGNLISANYGRIKGEIKMSLTGKVQFQYWFNPVPNERSLEYSGENLLKK